MAEEIVIGKLIIDTGELESSMASSKKAIIDLENEQKKLKKDTDNLTNANEGQLKSFVDNELALKKARAEYSANQKSVLELTKAQTNLDAALKANIVTQEQAKKNTAELTAARQKIDATTLEGAKAIAEINAKINANNNFVRENASAQEKAATITGNYRQKIFDLGNAFGGTTGRVIGFVQQGREITSSLGEVNNMVVNTAKNIVGFGNASKIAAVQEAEMSVANTVLATSTEAVGKAETTTTKATWGLNLALGTLLFPITAVVATVVLCVAIFKTFQPLVDKVEQGVAALSAAFNVIKNTILAVVNGTKSLSEAFSGLGGSMSTAAKEAAALTKAQQDLDDAMAAQEVTTARNRAEINKLNVELKNRTKSEKERLAISDEIIKKENEDFQQRKKIVDEEVRIARQAIAIKAQFTEREKKLLKETGDATKELAESRGGNYDAEFEALNKARLKAIALEDENTTNIEKQYNRRDKLADDAAAKEEKRQAKAQATADKARERDLKDAQNRIDILKAEGAQRNLSAEERIALAQKVFELENTLAKRSTSGTDQQKQLLANAQNLSTALLAIADEQITKEAEAQKKAFETTKAATQEQYDEQVKSTELLAEVQIKLLDKKLLSEKAYADEVVKINNLKNETLAITQANFDAAEKARRETEAANLKALDEAAFQIRLQDITDKKKTEAEINQLLRDEEYQKELSDLQANLDAKAISEELYLQKLSLANKKYLSDTKKNDKVLADQKKALNDRMLTDGIGALQALFGESKELAIAAALINTYQGITAGVKLGYPAAIPAVAFAAATGFAAVKNILKTNKGSGSGDAGGGSAPSRSSASNFVNTAQTETVARVTDAPTPTNTVVTPPVLILENLMEAQNNLAVKMQSS
jgi:hypothetical protein